MKRISALLILAAIALPLFAGAVASTSWVAAFMDLAGIDDVVTIAPASLRHPPEYELTPSDVMTVLDADIFCYAGYERMMSTISSALGKGGVSEKVKTENNLENVLSEAGRIAALAGTEPRTEEYEKAILEGRELVKEHGLDKLRAYVNINQTPLAYDLGLNVTGVFGSGALSASQIADAASGSYDIIIDNVHNPVAGPAAEVSGLPMAIWRNFPERTGRDALTEVIRGNIKALKEALEID